MIKFILYLLLIYTVISVIIVGSIIFMHAKDEKDRYWPRKEVNVINQSQDTITIQLSGSYTNKEMQQLDKKPDTDKFISPVETLPDGIAPHITYQSVKLSVPYKQGMDIRLPENFVLHINNKQGNIEIDREAFYELTNGKSSDNIWNLYITDSFLAQKSNRF